MQRSCLTLLVTLLLVQLFDAAPVIAEETPSGNNSPASWLSMLAQVSWEGMNAAPKAFPPDGRLWLIVGFKTCCLSNQIAMNWAEEQYERWNDSLAVVGVSLEPPRQAERVKAWLKARKITFPASFSGSNDLRTAIGFQTAPAMILIGADGSELFRTMFFTKTDAEKIEQLIASHYHIKDAK